MPAALRATAKGGVVVCGGIHMSDIPSFPYELLWGERVVRSVANLTRRDGEEFLALAATLARRSSESKRSARGSWDRSAAGRQYTRYAPSSRFHSDRLAGGSASRSAGSSAVGARLGWVRVGSALM